MSRRRYWNNDEWMGSFHSAICLTYRHRRFTPYIIHIDRALNGISDATVSDNYKKR